LLHEGFGEGVVIDGGDGVSSVGEWIDVVHGVEGLCIDTGDGVVPEGEGILLYACDGGDGVSCEGMHSDRLLSKNGEMFCDRIKGSCVNGGDEGFCSVLDVQCGGIYGKIFYT